MERKSIHRLMEEAKITLVQAGVPRRTVDHATVVVDGCMLLPRARARSARGEVTVAGWWLKTASRGAVLRMLRHELGHVIARDPLVRRLFGIPRQPSWARYRLRQVASFLGFMPYSGVSREEWFCEALADRNPSVLLQLARALR